MNLLARKCVMRPCGKKLLPSCLLLRKCVMPAMFNVGSDLIHTCT